MTTTVMLVDAEPNRALWLEEALAEYGYRVVNVAADDDLYHRVESISPDVVIIEADSAKRDTLEGMGTRTVSYPRPVVMFAEHHDADLMRAATVAGISPYVVNGLSAEGVHSIINVAINQFHEFRQLQGELRNTSTRLENQKVMEQAKCHLMERKGLTENQAYHLLRQHALERSRPIGEVASAYLRANGIS